MAKLIEQVHSALSKIAFAELMRFWHAHREALRYDDLREIRAVANQLITAGHGSGSVYPELTCLNEAACRCGVAERQPDGSVTITRSVN
jgi:hypothetical protein